MKTLPRIKIAHLPTPVEPLPRLSAQLGGPRLFVKRDDQTGLALGGNKTRKLEFLVAEALANGAHTLVTAGAAQSNHCRQTAAAAARAGLNCILVLNPPAGLPHSGEGGMPITGNLLLDNLFGAEIVWAERALRDQALNDTFSEAWEAGKRPFLIPYGGSNPTGAASYAYATQELLAQGVMCDWVVIPSSSGGTQAGLALGAKMFSYPGKVLGVSIDETKDDLCKKVARLATETAEYLDADFSFLPDDILVNADYLGDGYGILSDLEREAVSLFARSEGLLLDPVYTGRAAGGMVDLIKKGFWSKEETVLFWHTGGTPALFAEQYRSMIAA